MNILVHLVVILSFIIKKNLVKTSNKNSMAKIKSNTGQNGTSSLLFSLVNLVKV